MSAQKKAAKRPTLILRVGKLTHAQKTDLIQIGHSMSNWMYNTAQNTELPECLRDGMTELRLKWDAIRNEAGYRAGRRKK